MKAFLDIFEYYYNHHHFLSEFAYYRPSFLELPDVCDHLGLVLIRAGTD